MWIADGELVKLVARQERFGFRDGVEERKERFWAFRNRKDWDGEEEEDEESEERAKAAGNAEAAMAVVVATDLRKAILIFILLLHLRFWVYFYSLHHQILFFVFWSKNKKEMEIRGNGSF